MRSARFVLVSVLLFISGLAIPPELTAQSALDEYRPPGWAIPGRSAEARLSVPQFDELNATLNGKGRVRVIVRIKDPAEAPADTGRSAERADTRTVEEKRAAIGRLQDRVLQHISSRGAGRARKFEFIPFVALEADRSEFFSLLESSDIDFIEEDVPAAPTLTQSVPLIGADGSGTFSGYTGAGTSVAILDTGVDKTHPFLAGKVVDEACYSTTTTSGSLSLCPNGQSSQVGDGAGVNCPSFVNSCYHGTHVAGIAAGKSQSFSGVAKDASIIAIQVFSEFDSTYCGSSAPCAMSWTSDQLAGLQRVYALKDTHSIASVNMSLGGGAYTTFCDAANPSLKAAIDALRSAGIATVIASGNGSMTNAISSPGCISSAISVGATTIADGIASFSNSASILNLLAPGYSIYSSFPGGGYAYLSGTSMATPHVAGAWAVIKSKKPEAKVDEVLQALKSTGVSITDSRNGIAKPRIRVDSALTQISTQPTTLAWRSTDGRLRIWWMSGTELSTAAVLNSDNPIDTSWRVAGLADFDKNGSPDILWQNISDGRLRVWLMNGTSLIGSANLNNGAAVGTIWKVAGVGDFNGDGNADILWRNFSDGRLRVWLMTGTNLTGSADLYYGNPISTAWEVAAVADFTHDGKPDILWRNVSDGRLRVWFLNGVNISGGGDLNNGTPVSTTWSVVGAVDLNGDGRADILWQNTSDGRLRSWFMDGAGIIGTSDLYNGMSLGTAWKVTGIFGN